MTIVYCGDGILDLSPGTVVSVSIQRFDSTRPTSRLVSHTNELTIPPTSNNLRLLGLVDSKQSDLKRYTAQPSRVVINGYEVLSNSLLYVIGVFGGIKVQIYDTDKDYFDSLKGVTIREIMKSTGDEIGGGNWTTPTGVGSYRNTTTGITSAVADFGQGISTVYSLPWIYYRNVALSLCKKIKVQASDLVGNILGTSGRVKDLIITDVHDKFEYVEEIKDKFNVKARNSALINIVPPVAGFATNVSVNELLTQGEVDLHDGSNIKFPSGISTNYINCNISGRLVGEILGTFGDSVTVQLIRDRGGVFSIVDNFTYFVTAPFLGINYQFSGDQTCGDNDEYKFRVIFNVGTPTVNIYSQQSSITVVAKTNIIRDYIWFDYWLLRDLEPLDFLKDLIVRFGLIIKLLPSGEVAIKGIDDILSDRGTAIDWTSKFISEQEVIYQSKLASNNYISHANEKDFANIGRGNLPVTGFGLNNEATIFTSKINASDTIASGGRIVSSLPAYETGAADIADIANSISPTVATSRPKETFETGSGYRVAYFNDNAYTVQTGFQYFLDTYYKVYADAINTNKTVKRFYNLTERDIFEYDPFKIIFDNGEYFYINKIENFVPGKPTRVDMLRI